MSTHDSASARGVSVPLVDRCAVVGAGLIGGSVALAAAAAGIEVHLWDRNPEASRRVADRAETPARVDIAASAAAAVADMPLVVLAVPVEAIPSTMEELASSMNMQTVVTDTGSIKSRLQSQIEGLGSGVEGAWTPAKWVGGHPMAGRAEGGSDAADGKLFQGATWVLAPTEGTDAAAFARVRRFVGALGAHVLAVPPDVHDRLVAVVSHLPQLLATELMALAEATADEGLEAALAMAAGGFRDATRVAASDPELWTGILRSNREAVLAAIDGYLDRLAGVREAVASEDWSAVEARLAAGRAARERLPTKARVTEEVVDLVVPVDDRPGMVAAIATALGEVAVNIEDLHLQHADEVAAGAIVATVRADVTERALEALARRGLHPHVERRRG